MHFNLHEAGGRATRMVAMTGAAGLLSAAAVMGIGTGAFATQDVPCGTPGQAAVYETVERVPAQTLEEWAVESPGEGWEQGEGRFVETAAAVPEVPAVPEISHMEYKYSKVVVTQAHQDAVYEYVEHPAVYEIEYEYVKKFYFFGWHYEYTWKNTDSWHKHGWHLTGATRNGDLIEEAWTQKILVTPEVPELTKTVYAWFETDPGAPWTATGKSKKVITQHYVPGVPGKAAEGYTEYLWTKLVPAVTEEVEVSPEIPAGPPCEDGTIPEQPADLVEVAVSSEVVDCDAEVATTTTTTTTTPYVWDEEGEQWVLGEPVSVTETDERELAADECPVIVPIEDEVAGVEEERETPAKPAKPVKNAPSGDQVLGVEASAPAAVPTAVNAGVPAAAETDLTTPALLGGSSLMLLLAGWLQFGRRERGVEEG